MKVKVVLVIAGATFLLAGSADAKCNTTCLGHKITSLQHNVNQLTGELKTLSGTLNGLAGTVSGQGTTLNGLTGTVSGQGATLNSLSGNVNSLAGTVATQGKKLACFTEVPVTQYGDPSGRFGYSFTSDGVTFFNTTALDLTAPGDTVGAWALVDSCDTTTTATAAVRGILGSAVAHRATATSK
jgi:hypothetical protein